MLWLGEVFLLILQVQYSKSEVTCPCVAGTWSYGGDSFTYCNNPNNGRTDWCPTQTNSDGSYTSNLPFTYCEGEVKTACQAAKDQNPSSCPCLAEWGFRGEYYQFCADPINSGFNWCATEVDSNGDYITGKYEKCSTAVEESCLVAKDAADAVPDTTGCPCLSGGQWTFDGERQSYCKQPNGLGKKPWCPTSEAAVFSANYSSVDIAYCHNKKKKACDLLEGTRLPAQCPCVEGGQFTYQGQTYSYCEELQWCATEVDEAGQFVGKFARCRGRQKLEACHQLHELTTTQGQQDLFGEFTQTNTGCPCWFDLSREDCACCQNGGVQCGAPMQEWCTSRKEGRQSGCLGVPANHWTLSTTGHPCYWNTSRTDCAWCASGGAQCGPQAETGPDGALGSRCWDPEDSDYCDSVPGNCQHIAGTCDSQAQCKFSAKVGEREHWQCMCNAPDWTGNGLECFDSDGNPSPETTTSSSSGDVRLTLAVTTDFYVYPQSSSEFPSGEGETNLLANITELFTAGASCASDSSCNGTFVNLQTSP